MAKFLIIDDSKTAQILTRAMLDDLGHEVLGIADDGDVALQMYEELKPDVVTMDINMPKEDGLKASREILRKFPDAKIIIISSYDDPELIYHAIEGTGVINYIVKPVSKEKLQEILEEVVRAQG